MAASSRNGKQSTRRSIDEKWTSTAVDITYGRRSSSPHLWFHFHFQSRTFRMQIPYARPCRRQRRLRTRIRALLHLSKRTTEILSRRKAIIHAEYFCPLNFSAKKETSTTRERRPTFGEHIAQFCITQRQICPHIRSQYKIIYSPVGHMHLQLLPAGASHSLSHSAATLVMLLLRRWQFRFVAVARRNVYLLCVWQLLVIFGIACGPKWFACEALRTSAMNAASAKRQLLLSHHEKCSNYY